MVITDGMIGVSMAALKLGVSREVAVRLIQRRELPGALVAGRWLVEPTAVEAYLANSGGQDRAGRP
jgi:excisionase family DNA binding protein